MPLTHVQSLVSQIFCSHPDSREPLLGFPSSGIQAPDSVGTRGRPLRSEEHVGWSLEADRQPQRSEEHRGRPPVVELRSVELRRAFRGAARLPQDPFRTLHLAGFPPQGSEEHVGEAPERPDLSGFPPQGSEELIGEAPERPMRGSVEPDGRRQHSFRLRRATGALASHAKVCRPLPHPVDRPPPRSEEHRGLGRRFSKRRAHGLLAREGRVVELRGARRVVLQAR